MPSLLLWIGLTSSELALGAETRLGEDVYARSVDLIDRLYLYPEKVEASQLLFAAADGLADQVHWLMVEREPDGVYLRHGDGTPVGSVSVANLDTLPDALRALEEVISESGYATGDVDLRLEIVKGMTNALDRYSRVLSGDRLDRFDLRLKGTLVGVGSTVDLVQGKLVIQAITEGSPADLGGLRVGDKLIRIDGVSTVNMSVKDASTRIRGDVNTVVTLTVDRKGQVVDIPLTRAELVIPNVTHRVLADNIGYLKIDHFSQRTVENLLGSMAALRSMKALDKGLIIDLRHNTGGAMSDATTSADQFVTEGMLLRTAGADGGRVQNLKARVDAVDAGDEPKIPLVILVDEDTASGSEILAGALLELDRAVIIGYPTYGKGTVQKTYNLGESALFKLTVAQYILANDRRIAEGGIVPDAVLGPVEVDSLGIRFRGWEESRSHAAWDKLVPVVAEKEDSGKWKTDPEAFAIELGRRVILATEGYDRASTLAGLERVLPSLRTEQDADLVRAFEARGIDWRAAPTAGAIPNATTRVVTEISPSQPDIVNVAVLVENHGDTPLYRALVELECETFDSWSGLIVPVGVVPPGGRAEGKVAVRLSPGVESREDTVHVRLRTDRRPALPLGDEVLRAASSPIPRLSATARFVGEGAERRAEVTVRNLSNTPLQNLDLSFAHPGDGLEWLDGHQTVASVPAKSEVVLGVDLLFTGTPPAQVPLTLVLDAQRFRTLAEWPLILNTDGTAQTIEPPKVLLKSAISSAPVGPFRLPLQISDERSLDHVVVFANNEKVLWAGGGRNRWDLSPEFDLQPGINRIVALAQDDQGLVTRKMFVVRGESPAAADAEDHDTDMRPER